MAAQCPFELFGKLHKLDADRRIYINQDIDITFFLSIATRPRSEKRKAPNRIAMSQTRPLFAQSVQYLFVTRF